MDTGGGSRLGVDRGTIPKFRTCMQLPDPKVHTISTCRELLRLPHRRSWYHPGHETVSLRLPCLEQSESNWWEQRINRYFHACGCISGTVSLFAWLVGTISRLLQVSRVSISTTSLAQALGAA